MYLNATLARLTAFIVLGVSSSLGFSQEANCKKTVYLTFDTGNMSVAQTIADILNRQNIKARSEGVV
jgi:peptidoglycan/xylan/chitin deacetylase (PgdA/CDA1 family)